MCSDSCLLPSPSCPTFPCSHCPSTFASLPTLCLDCSPCIPGQWVPRNHHPLSEDTSHPPPESGFTVILVILVLLSTYLLYFLPQHRVIVEILFLFMFKIYLFSVHHIYLYRTDSGYLVDAW